MLGARKQKPPSVIDDQEKQRRLEAYRNAEASLRIEGLFLDDKTKNVFEMWVDGKITSEEKTKRIQDIASQSSE